MKITFYNLEGNKFFAIFPYKSHTNGEICIFLENEDGDGMQCNTDKVSNIIYEALQKYFEANY